MKIQYYQPKSTVMQLVITSLFQIILSMVLYKYHSKYFKTDVSFWFSMWFPIFICFLVYFWSLKTIIINKILNIFSIVLIAVFVETIALCLCIMLFGE